MHGANNTLAVIIIVFVVVILAYLVPDMISPGIWIRLWWQRWWWKDDIRRWWEARKNAGRDVETGAAVHPVPLVPGQGAGLVQQPPAAAVQP